MQIATLSNVKIVGIKKPFLPCLYKAKKYSQIAKYQHFLFVGIINLNIMKLFVFALCFFLSNPFSMSVYIRTSFNQTALSRLKNADDLGVPVCNHNFDCVVGGVCVKDRRGKGRCYCSSSCALTVPVQCMEDSEVSCMTMGENYVSKYDFRSPLCYHGRCVCPPTFDPNLIQPPILGFKATLPMKCDRHELQAMIVASPADSVYRGTTNATIYCCVNVDPRDFVPMSGVYFVQNGTRKREATSTPYDNFSLDIDTLFTVPTCWSLHINNVQLSDSGSYICIVQPLNPRFRTMNVTMEFAVKIKPNENIVAFSTQLPIRARRGINDSNLQQDLPANTSSTWIDVNLVNAPRMIQNLTIAANSTSALVTWETQKGPMLKIDLSLSDRSGKTRQVWHRENVKSPVLIEKLAPGTPYTLFITIIDGQTEPFKLSKHFVSNATYPDPPLLEAIRLVNGENGNGQMCEIEWRPPRRDRGFVTRYYVKISGRLRYVLPESGILSAEDFPQGIDSCTNYNQNVDKFINVTTGSQRFFACKYGPLKSNRIYSATLWVENDAGKSRSVTFNDQCVMDYAQPDFIEPPETLPRSNMSSFALEFKAEPDETNGPIVCYYLAIVPLPTNVSIENLPSPELIVMDTFNKALQNNMQQSATENNRFFAYIAESYMQYPQQTVVGDGNIAGNIEPCNALYLARYNPVDSALTPNLKYTGFLIARVDRDMSLHDMSLQLNRNGLSDLRTISSIKSLPDFLRNADQFRDHRRPKHTLLSSNFLSDKLTSNFARHAEQKHRSTALGGTARRQLSNIDPAYGFSSYFKPIILQENTGSGSALYILLAVFALFLSLFLGLFTIFYFLHRNGILSQVFSFFCVKSKHDLLKATPPRPIKVDQLPVEFMMRHRDSNFHFNQEFEMLPRSRDLDHSSSDQNSRKNRYNDIKACEATRVRLRKIPGDFSSDYINANFIKGYRNRKVFIASQGPLEHTIDDFWRMIWEQGCKIIIMVTNLRERTRDQCAKYWPDKGGKSLYLRTLKVKTLEATYYADYAVREFELTEADSSDFSMSHSVSGVSSAINGTNLDIPGSPLPGEFFSRSSSGLKESVTGSYSSNRPDSDYANVPNTFRPSSRTHSVNDSRERHRVVQYHFTNWNDYKAPECVALLRLVRKLRKLEDYNNSPVVVHCSAGVGRTGTLIAIDYLMDQCQEEGKVGVFNCVAEMRQQRNMMVQSIEQYVFIYKALAEHQLFGDTDLSVSEFRSYYLRLRMPLATRERERHCSIGSARSSARSLRSNSIIGAQSVFNAAFGSNSEEPSNSTQYSEGSSQVLLENATAISFAIKSRFKQVRNNVIGGSGSLSCAVYNNNNSGGSVSMTPPVNLSLIEAEFKNLSTSLEKVYSFDWAHKPENETRNRYTNAVPYDLNRFILSHCAGYDNTYINATSIKGYFYSYILAQDPLDAETAFDFWRMIHDSCSSIVVMLTAEEEFKQTEKYWPVSIEKKLILGINGELTIALLSQDTFPYYTLRKMQYRFKDNKQKTISSGDLEQYAFRPWKNGTILPSSATALVEFIGLILICQSINRSVNPIILHCKDGSSTNGVFCCVSFLLERLKSEHMIDVFQTVKGLKLQRPLMFTKLEQYEFCYDCIAEYLKSSS